jgi:hypothetical protein
LAVRGLSVIAVDWSGATRATGVWLAAIRDGDLVDDRPIATREQAIEAVLATNDPVVAGFDFSFSYPAWVGRWHGWLHAPDGWPFVATEGESWLRESPPPFWGYAGSRRPVDVELLRNCERRARAKSTFQINGPGSVGKGSVRGMPLLSELRAAGFAVWPFEAAGERTVVEIYPAALRRVAPDLDVGDWISLDQRDAVVSARVMWRHREAIRELAATTDPAVLLEGEIWAPGSATASP